MARNRRARAGGALAKMMAQAEAMRVTREWTSELRPGERFPCLFGGVAHGRAVEIWEHEIDWGNGKPEHQGRIPVCAQHGSERIAKGELPW